MTFIFGAIVGAVVMDYMWARKTGVDKIVYTKIKRLFSK